MKNLVIAFLATTILLLGACKSSTVSETEQPSFSMTAAELYAEYNDNEVAADAKYKGEVIDVTGYIYSIGRDITNTPYVILTDGGEWTMWGVQCMFTRSAEDEQTLSNLRKDMLVTIRGRCDGLIFNVQLEGCRLIED